MKASLRLSRKVYITSMAGGLLLMPLLGYLFLHVPQQQDYFRQRNYRVLALMSDQLSARIAAYGKALENTAERMKSDPKSAGEYMKTLFTELKFVDSQNVNANGRPDAAHLSVSRKDDGAWMLLDWQKSGRRVQAEFYLTGLMRQLGTRDVFDDVLLADRDGHVVFQQSQSGVRLVHLRGLRPVHEEKKDHAAENDIESLERLGKSGEPINLVGQSYQIFVQPAPLPPFRMNPEHAQAAKIVTPSVTAGLPAYEQFTLCGLVRTDRLRAESMQISYNVIALLALGLVLALLGWPFFKLLSVSPKERFRRADGWSLALSTWLYASVVSLFLLDAFVVWKVFRPATERRLRDLSLMINDHFSSEVRRLYGQLESYDQQVVQASGHEGAVRQAPCDDSVKGSVCETQVLNAESLFHDAGYLYFQDATWIDATGQQTIKWSVKREATRLVKVGSRRYFQDVVKGQLRLLDGGNTDQRLSLEPLYSMNTGENIVVLSKHGSGSLPVATITTRLLSLMRPVLPPGYGFAVIQNADGKVLFHSEEARNLTENFFEESDQEHELREIVWGGGSGMADARYQGRPHLLHVAPLRGIQDLPWSLVVFRDKSLDGTTNLEILTVASILFAAYVLALLMLWAAGWLLLRRTELPSLWPNERWAPVYARLIGLYLTVLAAGFACAQAGNPRLLTGMGFLAPMTALSGTFLILKRAPAGAAQSGPPGGGPWRATYIGAATLFVSVLSLIPSLSFMKAAYDSEMELDAKHIQRHFARQLDDRAQWVTEFYRRPQGIRPPIEVFAGSQWLLGERLRLDDQWDLYHRVLPIEFRRVDVPPARSAKPSPRYWGTWLHYARPAYNKYAIETGASLYPAENEKTWVWTVGAAPDALRLLKREYRGGGALEIEARVPSLAVLSTASGWGSLAAAFAVIVLLTTWICRKVFLLNAAPAPAIAAEGSGKLVVKVHPLGIAKERAAASGPVTIDLEQVAGAGGWAEVAANPELADNPVVVVEGIEHDLGDAHSNGQKIALLEKLVFEQRKTVLVRSAVDPGRWSDALTASWLVEFPEEAEPGWTQTLALFRQKIGASVKLLACFEMECGQTASLQAIGAEIAADLPQGARISVERLRQRVAAQARGYYQGLWDRCTEDQRLTLVQLAQEKMANPQNQGAVGQLLHKKLIRRDPALSVMNESFRQFVLGAHRPEQVSEWERAAARAGWSTWRGVYLVILAALALFLVSTQRQILQSWIPYFSAMASGIPTILQVFSKIRASLGKGAEV